MAMREPCPYESTANPSDVSTPTSCARMITCLPLYRSAR